MRRPIPFPLASGRYEVGPAMRRFGQAGQGFPAEEAHFLPDDLFGATIAAKLAVLRKAAHEAHLIASDELHELRITLQDSFQLIASEHPNMVNVDEDGATLYHLGLRLEDWRHPVLEPAGEPWPELQHVAKEAADWLSGQKGIRLLGDALALSAQEDLAITRGPTAQEPDRLEWLHVCLPSNWAPAEKIGRTFAAVHEPVVHSESLIRSQAQIIRAMIHAGPFVRYVWGIHRDPELCHNPRIHQAPPWPPKASTEEIVAQSFFRVERQTTHGFPELNRALFTIRYWVAPLAEVAADPWQRERLASALAQMDAEELSYKGLAPVRDHLVTWLRD